MVVKYICHTYMIDTQAETPREIYNILLLGESRSGKTRFLNELYDADTTNTTNTTSIKKKEHEYLITTNIDLCTFNYNIRGHKLRIQVWDTPGSIAFHQIIARFMIKPFYMIVIMLTVNMISKITYWLDFINEQQLSYSPIIILMENDSGISKPTNANNQQLDKIMAKYPYVKYCINIHGQSSYILKTIIEESITSKIDTTNPSSLCCNDRKMNRCCF